MDRSFSLQALAFRGEEIEPPRACGVSLLLLFRWSQAPSASMHSLVWNGGLEGHQIQLVLYRAVCFLFQFFVREQWEEGRSFSLQALAFRGEEIELPRACGVSLLLLFRWSQAPFASMHSLVLDMGLEGEGLHHDILLIVLRMVLSVPILSKGGVGRGPFLFAAGACFPRGGRRASSCLGGLASPSIPLESIVFQFTLLVLNLGVEGEWISSSCLCIGEGAAFLV